MGLYDGEENGTVQDINDKILQEETEELVSDKVSNIRDSMSSIWSESSSLWSRALDDPDKFFRQVSKSNKEKDKDLWDNFVVNASDAMGSLLDVVGLPGGYGNPNRIRHLMDDPFTAEEIVEQGVTGLYNYRTPTDAHFSECQKIGGLSVWNTKGWWRCLFPESAVIERLGGDKDKLESILTKEKVENDKYHTYGLFFPEYTGYMNWKLHMNQLIQDKKNAQQASRQEQKASEILTPEDLMFHSSSPSEGGAKNKTIVGNSQFVTFNSTPEGQEEIKKVKTYYDDGTVLVKSEKKVIPKDGTKPKVETSEKVVNTKDDRD